MNEKPDIVMERGDKIRLGISYGEKGQTLNIVLSGPPVWNAFDGCFEMEAVEVSENQATEQAADFAGSLLDDPRIDGPRERYSERLRSFRRLEDERAVNETAERLATNISEMSKVRMVAKHDVAIHRVAQDIKRMQRALEFDRGWIRNIEKRLGKFKHQETVGSQILKMLEGVEKLLERADSDRTAIKNEIDVLKIRVKGLASAHDQLGEHVTDIGGQVQSLTRRAVSKKKRK
jgi:hypothetical protein